MRVLAQVRFPAVLFIHEESRVAPFQAELRSRYPAFRQETGQSVQIALGPGGPAFQSQPAKVWRFSDVDGATSVMLAPDSITLDMKAYESRTDLLERLREVLGALNRHFAPGIAERVGLRYVSRLAGDGYKQIDRMVEPSYLGIASPVLRNHVSHSISEAALQIEEGHLLMRWGVLPANGTFDPFILEPLGEPCWVLDIDVSSAQTQPFECERLTENFGSLAERAYALFRHMVLDDFLVLHGGTL